MSQIHSFIPSNASPATLGISPFSAVLSYIVYPRCSAIEQTISPSRVGYGRNSHFRSCGPLNISLQTIVVTGGSDGMGKAVACQLRRKRCQRRYRGPHRPKAQGSSGGHQGIRTPSLYLQSMALTLVQGTAQDVKKQRFHYISADLTDAAECERVIAEVTEWNHGLAPDVVWCCAGYCEPGFFVETPVNTLRSQMDTVYWTAAEYSTCHSQELACADSSQPAGTIASETSYLHLFHSCFCLHCRIRSLFSGQGRDSISGGYFESRD